MNTHCECGICGHFSENECIKNECKCCSNFHLRSGTTSNEKLNNFRENYSLFKIV